jgi:metal-responsive CopG/Arc/MetJ family transcriptional regulator
MSRLSAILLSCAMLFAPKLSAQQREQTHSDTVSSSMHGPTHGDRAMMMKMMEASEARVDKLVQAMNQATGQKKVDAIAAVINELVAQRKMMLGHMRQMMPGGGPPER